MSRLAITSLVLTLSFVAACTTNEGAGGGGGSGSGSGSGGGGGGGGGGVVTVSPQAGEWFYAEHTPVSTTCPGNVDSGEAGDFVIDSVTASRFRVIPADGTAPFACTLTGGTAFSCPNRVTQTQPYPTIDATLTVHGTISGTFSAADRASGRQQATVDCTGTGCIGLAGGQLPCQYQVDFVVSAY